MTNRSSFRIWRCCSTAELLDGESVLAAHMVVTAETALVVLVAIAMVVGIAGTVLPVLPGLWVIWAAAVMYGVAAGTAPSGLVAMAIITVLAAAGTAAAFYLPQRKASSIGVPWWGQVVSIVLSVVGMFVVPLVGAPLGFALGIFLASLLRTRNLRNAWEATLETLKSMLYASSIQFAVGVTMAIVWVIWVVAA